MLIAIIEREDKAFVALCPELDIASDGSSIEEARANLIEALTLFFEVTDDAEVSRRLHNDVFATLQDAEKRCWPLMNTDQRR